MGNPILRKIAEPYTKTEILSEETKLLIKDMWETMENAGGIGLAAPQIGVSKQLTVIKLPVDSERYPEAEESEEYIIFNPEIQIIDAEKQGFWEGCLSVPGLRGYVERPKKIIIDYLDETAKKRSIELEDFLATVFQHELDHLFGKIYVDHIQDKTKLTYESEFHHFIQDEKDLEE